MNVHQGGHPAFIRGGQAVQVPELDHGADALVFRQRPFGKFYFLLRHVTGLKLESQTARHGDVKTEFTARREKNKSNSVYYGERIDKSVEKMERDEQNGMSPSVIAKIALKIAKSKNPPVYVVGGASYKLLVGLSKILPKRLVVWAIGKLYG